MEWQGYNHVLEVRGYIAKPAIDTNKLKDAAEIINSAKKPLIIAGQGVIISEAREEVENLSQKSGIPVCLTNARIRRVLTLTMTIMCWNHLVCTKLFCKH